LRKAIIHEMGHAIDAGTWDDFAIGLTFEIYCTNPFGWTFLHDGPDSITREGCAMSQEEDYICFLLIILIIPVGYFVIVIVILDFYNVFPSYCPACMATMYFDDPWPSDYYEGSAH